MSAAGSYFARMLEKHMAVNNLASMHSEDTALTDFVIDVETDTGKCYLVTVHEIGVVSPRDDHP